ncbi:MULTISPECIES: glycosyltransferase [Heyndrickxia]|uniref:glycosyltransferase n=1 Tax=Heyndrickxia TaxID=2837504 RepID=UPI002DBF08EF|nr:glycosyltransferase [Weizmannia sp. CD-2023]MEC2306274.1 glycosyltransferase [Weizmannia sp. CD-2023]MEC2340583.1 glycosyltransferase [Weizmannia sp. CD-2023]
MYAKFNHKEDIEKKKVLFVVEALGGGIFTYIVDLSNKLVNTFDVYIAYGLRSETPKNYEDYFDERIHLIRVKNFVRSLNLIRDVKAFFEIKRVANKIKPDLIHLHSSKAGALGRWAFNGKKVPLFYTPHGYSFLMQNSSRLNRKIYKAIEMASSWRHCTIISCSYGEHLETIKFTRDAYYISNGVNIEEIQNYINDYGNRNEKHQFTVFTLGRICHQKNPSLFNNIAKKLPNVKFIWIGDGELRYMLTSPNIEITGWLNRKEAIKRSLAADIFLLPSLWEGLPISLLESMYMKKLCIVSNVIGNKDVIKNNVNGYVCNTVDEFVEVIKTSKEQNQLALINNAYNDIVNLYNTIVMTEKYKKVYKKALKKGNI